jgi:hypothetical protein
MCASCAVAHRAANGASRTIAANPIITQTNTQTHINFQNSPLGRALAANGQVAHMPTKDGQTLFLLAIDQWAAVKMALR